MYSDVFIHVLTIIRYVILLYTQKSICFYSNVCVVSLQFRVYFFLLCYANLMVFIV